MPDFIHVLVRFYINFSSPSGYISDNLLAQFYPKKITCWMATALL